MYRVAVCDDVERDLEDTAACAAAVLREAGAQPAVERFRSAAGLLSARARGAAWDLIVLDIMMDGLERRRKAPCLVLDAPDGGKLTVSPADILYVEIFRRELVVHCRARTFSCTGSLSATLDALPADCFYRCHRSYVVNLAHVAGVQKYRFLLRGGGEVPIAMRPYQEARARWLDFLK